MITKTAFASSFYVHALSRTFALKHRNGAYEPDLEEVIQIIVKHDHSSLCAGLVSPLIHISY